MERLFTNPSGLIFLLLLPLILLLHLLRARPRRLVVPSLLLWQEGATASVANSFWQRLHKYRELVVHLLTALCLVLALAGLTLPDLERSQKKRMLMLDLSPAMSALTESGETRLEQAKEYALELIDELDDGDLVGLAGVGSELRLLAPLGTPRSQVRSMLEDAEVTNEGFEAIHFQQDVWGLTSKLGGDVEMVFLSGPIEASWIEGLPLSVAVKTFGKKMENQGVAALELRHVHDDQKRFEIDALCFGNPILRLEIQSSSSEGEEWKLLDARRAPYRFSVAAQELPLRGRLRVQESDAFSRDDIVAFELRAQEGLAIERHGRDESLESLLGVLGEGVDGVKSKARVWVAPELPQGLNFGSEVEGFVTYQPHEWWRGLEREVIEMAGPSFELGGSWQPLLSIQGKAVVAEKRSDRGAVELAFAIKPSEWPQFSQSNSFITLVGRWYREQAELLGLKGPHVTSGLLDSRQSQRVQSGEHFNLEARLKASGGSDKGLPLWPGLLWAAFLGIALSTYFVSSKSR